MIHTCYTYNEGAVCLYLRLFQKYPDMFYVEMFLELCGGHCALSCPILTSGLDPFKAQKWCGVPRM